MAVHENSIHYFEIVTPDVDTAVAAAEEHGAMIALGATEIPGHGKIAIYIVGGIQQGIWQLP